jgi:hypothetical protein
MDSDLKLAKLRYNEQRQISKKRNVDFHLSFEDWFSIWQSSGFWSLRGRGPGKYVMSRYGDQGPYSKDNVFIQLWEKNYADAWTEEKLKQANIKRSLKQKGISKPHSLEHNEKLRLAAQNRPKYQCPHCQTNCSKSNLIRWHLDKCKKLGESN